MEDAAATLPISHESTIFAEPIAQWGPLTITNSLVTSWLAVAIIIVLSIIISKKVRAIPGKLQATVETIIDAAMNLADSVTNDRKITTKVFPLVFAVFIFIIINNWLGLLPGVGSIGWVESSGGKNLFIPLFRGGTADVNTTLALSLLAIVAANVFGVMIVGGWNYFNKFINVKTLIAIPADMRHNKAAIIVNPIQFFVGLIEIVGEIAKVASLSFRLFGNIFAGEVLLTAMAALFAFILPIPFMFLEVLVGLIQALIFAVLTLVYFTIAAQDHAAEH
ncbi:MAG: FoF1 ATP synthase subunit a [Candidatus Komeilibacteria bacterium]